MAVLLLALTILLAYRERAGDLAGLFFDAASDDVVVHDRVGTDEETVGPAPP